MITDITPPNTEPVTLETAKLFLRIDHEDEDALIADFIQSARIQIETLCRQTLITRSQKLTLTPPFDNVLHLNVSPLISVDEVVMNLSDGTNYPVSLDDLSVNLRSSPAKLTPKTLGIPTWLGRSDIQAITVDVTAGYGEAVTDIPMPLRQAILLLVGQAYEYRAGQDVPSIPMMVDALIMPYRSAKL